MRITQILSNTDFLISIFNQRHPPFNKKYNKRITLRKRARGLR